MRRPRERKYRQNGNKAPPREPKYPQNGGMDPPREPKYPQNSDMDPTRERKYRLNGKKARPREPKYPQNGDMDPPRGRRYSENDGMDPTRKDKDLETGDLPSDTHCIDLTSEILVAEREPSTGWRHGSATKNLLPFNLRDSDGQPGGGRILVVFLTALLDLFDLWNQYQSMDVRGGTAVHGNCCALSCLCLVVSACCHFFTMCCWCADEDCCLPTQCTEIICAATVWLGHFPPACCKINLSKHSPPIPDLAVTGGRIIFLAVRHCMDSGCGMKQRKLVSKGLQVLGLYVSFIMPLIAYSKK